MHSKDDGKTWSNRISKSLCAIGKHKTRVIWRRLGRSKDKRVRIRLFGDVPRRLSSSAILEVA